MKSILYSCPILVKFEFSIHIIEKSRNIKFEFSIHIIEKSPNIKFEFSIHIIEKSPNIKFEFSIHIIEKSPNIKFHINPSIGSGVVPCGMTDGRTNMTKLIPLLVPT